MTLAEVLTAAALAAAVIGGVTAAIVPAQAAFAARQEALDLQQRVRVAVETIANDLRAAAAVRPYRTGAVADDSRAGVFFREGTISILPPAAPPGAPPGNPSRTYYLRTDGATSQLMQYDGSASAFPLMDDVVDLEFEYFGVPERPEIVMPEGEPMRASYGPTPPHVDEDDPADAWGAGENCIFTVSGGMHASRLAHLGGRAPVPLGAPILTDGPWCPDAVTPGRFDADLLRIVLVRVRLRLQAPAPFRGPAGPLFRHPGNAVNPRRWVPDAQIEFDVSLRNRIAE